MEIRGTICDFTRFDELYDFKWGSMECLFVEIESNLNCYLLFINAL